MNDRKFCLNRWFDSTQANRLRSLSPGDSLTRSVDTSIGMSFDQKRQIDSNRNPPVTQTKLRRKRGFSSPKESFKRGFLQRQKQYLDKKMCKWHDLVQKHTPAFEPNLVAASTLSDASRFVHEISTSESFEVAKDLSGGLNIQPSKNGKSFQELLKVGNLVGEKAGCDLLQVSPGGKQISSYGIDATGEPRYIKDKEIISSSLCNNIEVSDMKNRTQALEQERKRLNSERRRIEQELENIRLQGDTKTDDIESKIPDMHRFSPNNLKFLEVYLATRIAEIDNDVESPQSKKREGNGTLNQVDRDEKYHNRYSGHIVANVKLVSEQAIYSTLPTPPSLMPLSISKPGEVLNHKSWSTGRVLNKCNAPQKTEDGRTEDARVETHIDAFEPPSEGEKETDKINPKNLTAVWRRRLEHDLDDAALSSSKVAIHSGEIVNRAVMKPGRFLRGQRLSIPGEGWHRLYSTNKTSRDVALRKFVEAKLMNRVMVASAPSKAHQSQDCICRRLSMPYHRFSVRPFVNLHLTGVYSSFQGQQTREIKSERSRQRTSTGPFTFGLNRGISLSSSARQRLNVYRSAMKNLRERLNFTHGLGKRPEKILHLDCAKSSETVTKKNNAVFEDNEKADQTAEGEKQKQDHRSEATKNSPASYLSPTKASEASTWNRISAPATARKFFYASEMSNEILAAKGEYVWKVGATHASLAQQWNVQKKKDRSMQKISNRLEYQAPHSKEILAGKDIGFSHVIQATKASKAQLWRNHLNQDLIPSSTVQVHYLNSHSKEILEGKSLENHFLQATAASQLSKRVGPTATSYKTVDPSKLSGRSDSARTRIVHVDKSGDGQTRKLL